MNSNEKPWSFNGESWIFNGESWVFNGESWVFRAHTIRSLTSCPENKFSPKYEQKWWNSARNTSKTDAIQPEIRAERCNSAWNTSRNDGFHTRTNLHETPNVFLFIPCIAKSVGLFQIGTIEIGLEICHLSGAILHSVCIINGKFQNQRAYVAIRCTRQ